MQNPKVPESWPVKSLSVGGEKIREWVDRDVKEAREGQHLFLSCTLTR